MVSWRLIGGLIEGVQFYSFRRSSRRGRKRSRQGERVVVASPHWRQTSTKRSRKRITSKPARPRTYCEPRSGFDSHLRWHAAHAQHVGVLKAISERMERCHRTAQIKNCDGSDQFVGFHEQSFGDPNTPTQLISTDGDSQYRWTNMYYRPPATGSVSVIPPASEVAER